MLHGRRIAALTATLCALGALGAVTAPASGATASVTTARHLGRRLYPTVAGAHARRAALATATTTQLVYRGGVDNIGVTTGTPRVYLVFWGSQWGTASGSPLTLSNDTAGVAPRLQSMFSGIGTNSELWSGVMTQYCEGIAIGSTSCPSNSAHVGYPTGGALAGVWADTATAAPSSATGHQIGVEAVNAAAHFGNTTGAANRNVQYVIVSPHGTTPDGFNTQGGQFCAWHDYNGDSTLSGGAVTSPYGDIAFTNLPYIPDAAGSCGQSYVNAGSAGALDGVTIVAGHEYAETITDQNPAGGWTDGSGNENADKCAWIGTGGTTGAQNVSFATGSFAMQATWSNDVANCQIAHAVVGSGGGATNDFSMSATPSSLSVAQGSNGAVTVSTATTSGSAQTVSLSASTPSGVTASFSPSSVTSGGSSSLTLAASSSAATGSFTVTITGTAASGSHTTSVALTVTAPSSSVGTLSNGVAVTNLSGATGAQQVWQLAVPAGQASVVFSISGGTGDADLYVRRGAIPTLSTYDCRPYITGNNESCSFSSPVAATYYVMLNGYAAYSGVTLKGRYTPPASATVLVNGVPVTSISGATGSQQYWKLTVPAGMAKAVFTISGGTGDADLYVKRGALPTTTSFDCRPYLYGNNESCTFNAPVAADYYVMLRGYASYSGVTLTGKYS